MLSRVSRALCPGASRVRRLEFSKLCRGLSGYMFDPSGNAVFSSGVGAGAGLSMPRTESCLWNRRGVFAGASAFAALAGVYVNYGPTRCEADATPPVKTAPGMYPAPEEHELVNWSGTHSVLTHRYFEPENLSQLKAIVAQAHAEGLRLRPVGSALSPNAIAFSEEGMVNLAQMDGVLHIDKESMRVTVQSGARVSQVVEAIRPYGLTLQNYASIAEQQIGGFIQVGAHGTGVSIPPVDEQVVALKLITPAAGEVDLSIDDDDPMLFKLARTSLGLLGVVAEVTLQCVPAHSLVERTFVASHAEVRANHKRWLSENRHLRYMWIPHTDSVVVVTCNPVKTSVTTDQTADSPMYTEAERLAPARDLLKSVRGLHLTNAEVDKLSFTSLRDELLAVDPLNTAWVRKVNQAEAEFWRRSAGTRVDSSDRILGFDCGGQQWVSEVVFPIPNWNGVDPKESKPCCTPHAGRHPDLSYVESLLKLIEEKEIPAPAPIEQRWTAPSTSPMSPACARTGEEWAAYSWVGIIMYLPEMQEGAPGGASVEATRKNITKAFEAYRTACEERLWGGYGAVEHWAKIEAPECEAARARLQARTAVKYPTGALNLIRRELFDPRGILSNELTETIFGGPAIPNEAAAKLTHRCPDAATTAATKDLGIGAPPAGSGATTVEA